jgi:hypothetical protein
MKKAKEVNSFQELDLIGGLCTFCFHETVVERSEEKTFQCGKCGGREFDACLSYLSRDQVLPGVYRIDFLWCFDCEKVYPIKDTVKLKGVWCRCGSGGIGIHLHPWAAWHWPRSVNKRYPEVPIVGKDYPLYGRKKRGKPATGGGSARKPGTDPGDERIDLF